MKKTVFILFQETSSFRKQNIPASPYQKPLKSSVRPPLIPVESEPEKQEGFFHSLGNLFLNVGASVTEIFGGFFPGFRKKPQNNKHHQYQQQQQTNSWPLQESFAIPEEDEPPSLETKTPTQRKTYAFMDKDQEKTPKFRLGHSFSNGWDGDFQQQRKQQQHHQQQKQQQLRQQHFSEGPHTYYEQSGETKEVVFGAAQEQDDKREMEIKAINYSGSMYDHRRSMRSRVKHMGYTNEY